MISRKRKSEARSIKWKMFIKEKMMRSKDSIFLSYDLTFLFLLFFIIDGQPLADLFEMPSIIIKEKRKKISRSERKKNQRKL